MLSFNEFHSWISIRPIELLFILFGWLIYSILLVLRDDFSYSITNFHLFLPLFITNAIHSYFILIVLLRIWFDHKQRTSLTTTYTIRLIIYKLFIHLPLILCLIIFNYLLYKVLNDKHYLSINLFIHKHKSFIIMSKK